MRSKRIDTYNCVSVWVYSLSASSKRVHFLTHSFIHKPHARTKPDNVTNSLAGEEKGEEQKKAGYTLAVAS